MTSRVILGFVLHHNISFLAPFTCRHTKIAMVVTEFAFVTVRPEVQADVLREGTKTGDLIRHVMATALRQPGAREAHYAAAVERPNQLWLFLDWDTLEDHERYRTTECVGASPRPCGSSAASNYRLLGQTPPS
jgi:hypothetical protein